MPGPKGTAVLELTGLLLPSAGFFTMLGIATSVRSFMQQLAAAGADPAVKGIVVLADSPGGSIRLLPEAAALMRQVRENKDVVAAVTGMNASAAYWITSNATRLEATPSAQIGAIGVIATRVSYAKQLAKEGIDVSVFTAGKHKGEGHEALPVSEAERTAIQAQVDNAYSDFVADIAAGRHVSASTVRSGYAEGRLVSAKEALRLGMIDQLATVDDTMRRAALAPADRMAALQAHRVEFDGGGVVVGASAAGARGISRASPGARRREQERDRVEGQQLFTALNIAGILMVVSRETSCGAPHF